MSVFGSQKPKITIYVMILFFFAEPVFGKSESSRFQKPSCFLSGSDLMFVARSTETGQRVFLNRIKKHDVFGGVNYSDASNRASLILRKINDSENYIVPREFVLDFWRLSESSVYYRPTVYQRAQSQKIQEDSVCLHNQAGQLNWGGEVSRQLEYPAGKFIRSTRWRTSVLSSKQLLNIDFKKDSIKSTVLTEQLNKLARIESELARLQEVVKRLLDLLESEKSSNSLMARIEALDEKYSRLIREYLIFGPETKRIQRSIIKDLNSIQEEVNSRMRSNAFALAKSSRLLSSSMSYDVGIAHDRVDENFVYETSLFNFTSIRVATNPSWFNQAEREVRSSVLEKYLGFLNAFGFDAILSVSEDVQAQSVLDFTLNQDFMPVVRTGFHELIYNSKKVSDRNLEGFTFWIKKFSNEESVKTFKIDNEPFWSTTTSDFYGYDPITVGNDQKAFEKLIEKKYGSVDKWLKSAKKVNIGYDEQELRNYLVKGSQVLSLPGSSFVDFLKETYTDIHSLNSYWGESYSSWGDVFPPFPRELSRQHKQEEMPAFDIKSEEKSIEALSFPLRDRKKWEDWAKYWPVAINNQFNYYFDYLSKFTDKDITTNSIGGSFLNNHGDMAVINALFPWSTSKGFDVKAIDFYHPGFTEIYLSALMFSDLSTKNQYPRLEIHETGGSDRFSDAWYMTAFSFAHGSSTTLFWRRDRQMPIDGLLGVSDAVDNINDSDLQKNSRPVYDDVVLVYPYDVLFKSFSESGSPRNVFDSLRAFIVILKRLQFNPVVFNETVLKSVSDDSPKLYFLPAFSSSPESFKIDMLKRARSGSVLITDSIPQEFIESHLKREYFLKERVLEIDDLVSNDVSIAFKNSSSRSPQFGLDLQDMDVNRKLTSLCHELDCAKYRKITYVREDGSVAVTHKAVRASNDCFYYFLSPWSGPVKIRSTDFKGSKLYDIKRKKWMPKNSVVSGPAVFRECSSQTALVD